MRGWLELLPARVLAARPVLGNALAGALLSTGRFEEVDGYLCDVERWLDERGAADPGAGQPGDSNEARRLPAAVAVHRAGLSLVTGDPSATVAHARRALALIDQAPDLLEADRHLGRAAAGALIGLASWSGGDLETAREAYVTSVSSMRRAGHRADVLGLSLALADILIAQGQLRAALRTFESALPLPSEPGHPALRGTADMLVGSSVLYLERNELTQARNLLARSDELGEHNGLPQNRYRRQVALAGICAAEGDLERAAILLAEAERVYVGDFSPNVRPIPARRARMHLRRGHLDEALEWAHGQGLSADDDLSYRLEYEHVTLARILLARHERESDGDALDVATRLLDRLLRAADAGHRNGSVIEILILQALANRTRGDLAAAVPLDRALRLAEPEGYVRIFVDEGAAMAGLLEAATRRRTAPGYARALLSALGPVASPAPDRPLLIEPLSVRELDVLRLLATDLGGPDIARRLVVSLNTVRTHTKNIYSKLGVNNRRSAVRRAHELDLL